MDCGGRIGWICVFTSGPEPFSQVEEIFWRLRARHFWRSGSRVPDVPHRGYQLIQKIIRNDEIDGVEIDRNLTVNDNFGQSVLWLASKQFNAGLRTPKK